METTTTKQPIALVWSWRHGLLRAHVVHLDDLPSSAYWGDESDDCAAHGVETAAGFVPIEEYRKTPEFRAYKKEQGDRYRKSMDQAAATETHRLDMRGPDVIQWHYHASGTEAEMCAQMERLAPVVGVERLRLTRK